MRQLSEVNQAMVEAAANENDDNKQIPIEPIDSDLVVAHRIHDLTTELIHLVRIKG